VTVATCAGTPRDGSTAVRRVAPRGTRATTLWIAFALAVAVAATATTTRANGLAGVAPPAAVTAAIADARLSGDGVLRWFGLKIYEARLWVDRDGLDPMRFARAPFALDLRYARALKGDAIARTSLEEMTRLGFGDPQRRDAWFAAMRRIFPDVEDGDRLTGVNRPGGGVQFYRNDRNIGAVPDPDFAAAFFAIWLDPRTNAPELRDRLLDRAQAPTQPAGVPR
jgi:hypothetical protein